MKVEYYKEYSNFLNRDMEFKMYGHSGPLCLVIPCQDGRFFEWEDRHMFNLMGDLINDGRVQFVTVDSVDHETWSSFGRSDWRMAQQENWVQYVMNELIPSALAKAGKDQSEPMMVMGASMGATHAANLFFRFPDRFNKVLALSGIYDMSPYIYDGNFDENFYKNNPMSYLPNMPHDHEYIQKYNQANAVFVVGQGAWENECQNDLRKLADVLYKKGIHSSINFWGYDIPHDWPSWERQISLYLPGMV
ncbi:esterase family protein [Ileibacterium valens]|uniref:esterase family protein n=1 Tax=Ileibacterium valens TaxID=1862668 RepID=UPI00272C2C9A|nr:alpha/beta hydrolase-fold protein [Ileibacterium valens]